MTRRIRSRAVTSLAAAAVAAAGVSALTSAAAHADGLVNGPVNGPIAYTDGQHWSVVDADGTGKQTITPSGGGFDPADGVRDVAFSRDGSWAAFADRTNSSLWVSWADGTHARRIAPSIGTYAGDLHPAWSPDAKTIVFSRIDNAEEDVPQLWTVPSDGSAAPTVLVPFSRSDMCSADDPSFALDGSLAYTSMCAPSSGGWHASVVIIDPATKAVKRTIPGFRIPRFSPDGSRLAAFSQVPDQSLGDAHVMATDGSGDTALDPAVASGCAGGNDLAWSPDGSRIAYAKCLSLPGGAQQISVTVQPVPSGKATTPLPPTDCPDAPPQPFITWTVPFTAPTTQDPGRPDPAKPPVPGRPSTLRLGGGDRVGTSITVADAAYGPQSATKAKVAVLSRSDNFADALAGNALAAQKGGPLLLTGGAKLDPAVGAELGRLLPKGATVYVLGGTGALSSQVEADVKALGLTPRRLAGGNRFETATKIAAEVSPHPHTVLVATGVNFPDALAAGAAAATDPSGGVVLLSNDRTLPDSTKAYLAGVNPATSAVYGVGGQGVAALNTLAAFKDHFTKLSGDDRYATDAAVAGNATLYPHPAQAGLATGRNWPDALSGGAFIGAQHGPLLLTDGAVLPAGAGVWLHSHGSQLTSIPVFGGVNAVPDGAVEQAGIQAWGAGKFDMR